MRKGKEKKNS